MKTISEYLSGQFDEELNVLVAEARGWKDISINKFQRPHLLLGNEPRYIDREIQSYLCDQRIPPFSTSLDACRELLVDLTEEETKRFGRLIVKWNMQAGHGLMTKLFRASAQQICVAYLIVKGETE